MRASLAATLLVLALPMTAWAQAIDCTGLRSQIEAARTVGDQNRLDVAIRQQQAEIDRARDYADESGCNGTVFDVADPQQCRMLARRVQQLQSGLQRLRDQAAQGDPDQDDRRHALVEQFNAYCAGAGDETADPGTPGIVPVDPDAPSQAPPAASSRFGRVFCVRQCDGAYYPLAVDVSADRLETMDKLCKAQCPNAESSAFTSRDGEDMGEAAAADGSTYASLPAAFKFRSSVTPSCSCRAPHQSWAEALAQADALLEPHKGDVTVTPAIAAAMAQPIAPAQPGAAATKPVSSKPSGGKRAGKEPPPSAPSGAPPLRSVTVPRGTEAAGSNPGEDLTRQFRKAAPTL